MTKYQKLYDVSLTQACCSHYLKLRLQYDQNLLVLGILFIIFWISSNITSMIYNCIKLLMIYSLHITQFSLDFKLAEVYLWAILVLIFCKVNAIWIYDYKYLLTNKIITSAWVNSIRCWKTSTELNFYLLLFILYIYRYSLIYIRISIFN